jgi:hypothetical protein
MAYFYMAQQLPQKAKPYAIALYNADSNNPVLPEFVWAVGDSTMKTSLPPSPPPSPCRVKNVNIKIVAAGVFSRSQRMLNKRNNPKGNFKGGLKMLTPTFKNFRDSAFASASILLW